MEVALHDITALLQTKHIPFSVSGPEISVRSIAGIGSRISHAVCYYDGNEPSALDGIQDSIIFCRPELEVSALHNNTLIFTDRPQLCFYHVSSFFDEKPQAGIHSQTVIHPNSQIGSAVSIGPFCVLDECSIGENVIIDSGVRIYKGTVIGNNVRIQSNSVIGAMGVMWTWDNEGSKIRCVQTGNVIIEENVFIGSNITIVRGAFENKPTIIGRDTMIAHGTMIGHGSIIGARNHFANNVSIAGSVVTGENCFFGSGSIVRPHITLPRGTTVGAGAVVVKDFLQEGLVLIGNPAREMIDKKDNMSGVPAPL